MSVRTLPFQVGLRDGSALDTEWRTWQDGNGHLGFDRDRNLEDAREQKGRAVHEGPGHWWKKRPLNIEDMMGAVGLRLSPTVSPSRR